ncbi:UNKNOWN [Stylonychia lemnae]|uniref:Uncharacterized protein n=1 Tax=Stylonychia lemnae TaxID=5949 RepID=A0A078A8L0_STYLE|nr:UNKNOWN [Stylonychia lemnae]|eukprot:CDW78216.1 UNKNOWN [Stylonychia lemnae]
MNLQKEIKLKEMQQQQLLKVVIGRRIMRHQKICLQSQFSKQLFTYWRLISCNQKIITAKQHQMLEFSKKIETLNKTYQSQKAKALKQLSVALVSNLYNRFIGFSFNKIRQDNQDDLKQFYTDTDASLLSVKLESEHLCRLFFQNFNKAQSQIIIFRVLDPSIFIEQELGTFIETFKLKIREIQITSVKLQYPFHQIKSSTEFQKIKSFLKLENVIQKQCKTDVKLVRAFRLWQKQLLNHYLDCISHQMRQTKKKVLNQRFLFITKKIQFRMRKAFLRWNYQAKLLSQDMIFRFDLQSCFYKQNFGALKILNRFLMFRKQTMTIPQSSKSLMMAFQTWKINTGFLMQYDYVLRSRQRSMLMLVSIMQKNLGAHKNIAFWRIKEDSDSNRKHSAKKLKNPIGVSNNSPFYKSIIIPRLDISQKAKQIQKTNQANNKECRKLLFRVENVFNPEKRGDQLVPIKHEEIKLQKKMGKSNDQSLKCGYQILKIIYKNKKLKLEKLLGQKAEKTYFKRWQENIRENQSKDKLMKDKFKSILSIYKEQQHKSLLFSMNKWKRLIIKRDNGSLYTRDLQHINNSIILTQSQINYSIEQKIQQKLYFIKSNKNSKEIIHFVSILERLQNSQVNQAFQEVRHFASQYITNQKHIRDKFEIIEQEKQVMEEEYGNALSFNEDLQCQFEAIIKVSCSNCFQTRQAYIDSQYNSNGSNYQQYQQHQINQRPSVIVEQEIESSLSNMELTRTDKSLKRPLEMYMLQNQQQQIFKQSDSQGNLQHMQDPNNFREDRVSFPHQNQNNMMISTGTSNFGSAHQSGRSTTDLTRGSPSNLQSRLTSDTNASNFMQGRRFTFSPMIGPNGIISNPNYQVIQEQQNECESSFKTENSNNKDIVHQYFDFLHKENENLNMGIYQLESQIDEESIRFEMDMNEMLQQYNSLQEEIKEYESFQANVNNQDNQLASINDEDEEFNNDNF